MSLFIGIEGLTLSEADQQRIIHPATAGVILFTRNYDNPEQLLNLTSSIRAVAPEKLISVDHEGGRVQRFRGGFTHLPAAGQLGDLFDVSPLKALKLAEFAGIIAGYELRQFDIDFSFTPVLDLRDSCSTVIGDRAFHTNPAVVILLAQALRRGLRQAGMMAVGKHYPGHGRVQGDSHLTLPHDNRHFDQREADRLPFIHQIKDGIEAIMSAHILLPEYDCPAGFASECLAQLRDWGFEGAIISDDLDMAGAKFFSHAGERAQAALSAGADVAMICNTFTDMDIALNFGLTSIHPILSKQRLSALRAKKNTITQREYQRILSNFHTQWTQSSV